MKRVLSLITCALLLGAVPVFAQPAPLPDDERFDQTVAFSTGTGGEELDAMITALARSVGLTPIVDDIPDKMIVFDIGDPKPFRQVWDLVLALNDLDYVLQENDIVVVGSSASLARLRDPMVEPTDTDMGEATVQRFYRVNNDVDQVVAILDRAVAGITVEALPGTGALVVVGTEGQQEEVAQVLAEFDRPADVVELTQRTYFLSHANAADLAATLVETRDVAASTGEGVTTTALDQFTVVAEERTNSLIVTGTAEVQGRLSELIARLDEPQPQVNIQVRIQEITQRSAVDLGIDWTAGFGNLTANVLGGGLGFIFDTTQVISSLNVLAVLDALETQGLSRRVDDTNVTVLNNGTGTIQSGGQIFITIPGAEENIERTIPYGVQIDVTPRITADGRVTLVIDAKVEDVLSTTNDPSFLNLSSRNVTTTVTVEEGQTLLLGGLLQSQLNITRNRIPILSSIPLIGDLFGTTVTEEDNTDLLVIVTALILD